MNETDVVIIGAGHNVLTCASYLAMAGLRGKVDARPTVVGGAAAIREAVNAVGTGNILRKLSLEQQRSLLDLFTRSAGEMLDERFESDLVKALFGFDAIVGNYASPYAAGSAYVMLHHAFGEVNGKKAVWGHAIGGMGAI